MVHVLAMRQLVHHDHLYIIERQPCLGVVRGFENELDDLASIEVAADELAVGFVFLQGGDG